MSVCLCEYAFTDERFMNKDSVVLGKPSLALWSLTWNVFSVIK